MGRLIRAIRRKLRRGCKQQSTPVDEVICSDHVSVKSKLYELREQLSQLSSRQQQLAELLSDMNKQLNGIRIVNDAGTANTVDKIADLVKEMRKDTSLRENVDSSSEAHDGPIFEDAVSCSGDFEEESRDSDEISRSGDSEEELSCSDDFEELYSGNSEDELSCSSDSEEELLSSGDSEECSYSGDSEDELSCSGDSEEELSCSSDSEEELLSSGDSEDELSCSGNSEDELSCSSDSEEELLSSGDSEECSSSGDSEDELSCSGDSDSEEKLSRSGDSEVKLSCSEDELSERVHSSTDLEPQCYEEDSFQILAYQSSSEESVQKIDAAEAAERERLWKEEIKTYYDRMLRERPELFYPVYQNHTPWQASSSSFAQHLESSQHFYASGLQEYTGGVEINTHTTVGSNPQQDYASGIVNVASCGWYQCYNGHPGYYAQQSSEQDQFYVQDDNNGMASGHLQMSDNTAHVQFSSRINSTRVLAEQCEHGTSELQPFIGDMAETVYPEYNMWSVQKIAE